MAKTNVHDLVQSVLERFNAHSPEVQTVFGMEQRQAEALWVVLSTDISPRGEVPDINHAFKAVNMHVSHMSVLSRRGVIHRTDKQSNWTLSDQTIENLRQLAGQTSTASSPVQKKGPAEAINTTPLTQMRSLSDVREFVDSELTRIGAEIAETKRSADEKVAQLEGQRDEFLAWVKKLAGEIN